MRKFAIDKKLNLQTSSNEYIKRWIYAIKAMKKNAEMHTEGNIRTFFT